MSEQLKAATERYLNRRTSTAELKRIADAYIALVNAGADRDGKVTDLIAEARKLREEATKLGDLLERARIILAEECGDNYYANCLVDEIESVLGTNEPKGGAR